MKTNETYKQLKQLIKNCQDRIDSFPNYKLIEAVKLAKKSHEKELKRLTN